MMPYMNQNPNYYAQYLQPQTPYQNPYLQRMENLQQFQQTINSNPVQPLNTIGKIVESIDIVKATDIPMDGNMYYFPKADGSEVYGKAWMQNGQTRILTFKPSLDENPTNVSSNGEKINSESIRDVLTAIQSDLKIINEKLEKFGKTNKPKGGAENE